MATRTVARNKTPHRARTGAAVKVAPKRIRPVGANRENVRRLHEADATLSQVDIAEKLHITRQRVKQIAVELGIEIGPSGRRNDAVPPNGITKEEIRAWRLARQLTQAALATMLGVSTDTLARWERGLCPPPAMLAVALEGLTCAEVA